MRKRFMVFTGAIVMSAAMMFTGCVGRTVGVSNNSSYDREDDDEETTKKKSKSKDEDETTKKSYSWDDEDETTKKSSKKSDDEDETTKKSSGKSDEEETTKKSSKNGSTAVPSGWKQYSGTGYSLYIDDSEWTKTSIAGAELGFTHIGTAGDGFAENINIMTQDTSLYHLDLDGYKDLSLDQYEQLGYDVETVSHMTVNGVEGYYIVTVAEQSGITCYIAQYFTLIDDTAYVFTFVADEEDFEELEDEVLSIFETVEFE